MIGERRGRIGVASRSSGQDRDLLKGQIKGTLALCEGNVDAKKYYRDLWNGWMTANRAKLNL